MPLLDSVSVTDLRPWLVRTLEPVCDADPDVLADYVLALLKHDAPEADLRNMFVSQLEDFLDKETTPFVDQLFAALRSKSYMPYAAASPPAASADPGIPIPLDALVQPAPAVAAAGLKRPADGDHFDRPPPKGPRLHSDPNFSRYGPPQAQNGPAWRGPRNGNGAGPRGGFANTNGRQDLNPRGPRRGPCKDYHTLGYCARGALCPYSHGEDAISPQMPFGMVPQTLPGLNVVPFMTAMPNTPFAPFAAALAGAAAAAAGGGYDPTQAHMDMVNRGPVMQDLTPYPDSNVDPEHHGHSDASRTRGRGHGRGRGRDGRPVDHGRGTFERATFGDDVPSEAPAGRPRKGENKTLVVEKIPSEHLSLDGVNVWFKRFGTVTNVAIDARGAKALVSFATPDEAHAAWKSEDAVFGNRFVKVFWHRPVEGRGAAGTKLLAASAALVENLNDKPQPHQPSEPPQTKSDPPKKKPTADASALAAKQQLLERQIAEQKTLMSKYMSASTPEEKKELRDRLRKLDEEMKNGTTPAAPATSEEKEKERLDKELELRAAETEMTNGAEDAGSTTEDLKAKLAKLREEAAALGISESSSPSGYQPNGGYRGYRGRGRGGRGYYRGRGVAMPMRSMKLDNRPKKLLVKGTSGDDAALQTVRSWFDTMGQVESASLQPSGDIVITFHNRSFAEQALARPANISGVGAVQVSWHSDASAASSASKDDQMDGSDDTFMRDEPRSPRMNRDDDDDVRRRDDDDDPTWDDDEDDRRRRR